MTNEIKSHILKSKLTLIGYDHTQECRLYTDLNEFNLISLNTLNDINSIIETINRDNTINKIIGEDNEEGYIINISDIIIPDRYTTWRIKYVYKVVNEINKIIDRKIILVSRTYADMITLKQITLGGKSIQYMCDLVIMYEKDGNINITKNTNGS